MSNRVAILISRQPRQLMAQTWWLCAARAAADFALARGMTLVSGRGLTPIDYTRWYFAERGGHVVDIDMDASAERRDAMAERDRRVVDAADELIAVKISVCGNMERLALDALAAGKPVHVIEPPMCTRAFQGNLRLLEAGAKRLAAAVVIPGEKRSAISDQLSAKDQDSLNLRSSAKSVDALHYLWHFTRGCPGPWPGQALGDYFRGLTENAAGSAHAGFDALTRIMDEKLIRACARMFRGKYSMVSFTECSPDELIRLRAYRPSLIRWNFEPYAVGIRRSAAEQLGARPVQYLPSGRFRSLAAADKPYFQKHEPPDVDYSPEREWRISGDVPLADIDPSDLRVYVGQSA